MTTPDSHKLIVGTAFAGRQAFDCSSRQTSGKLFCVGRLPSCLRTIGRCRGSAARGVIPSRSGPESRPLCGIGTEPHLLAGRPSTPTTASTRIRARRMVSVGYRCRLRHCRSRRRTRKRRPMRRHARTRGGLPGRARTPSARVLSAGSLSRLAPAMPSLRSGMACPLNNVRTWLRRSLLKLRECLER